MHSTRRAAPNRRAFVLGAAAAGAAMTGFPAILRARNAPIRLGMPMILSGRVAQLGISTVNAAQMSIDAFNAAGGLDGRPVELLPRDSKARPDETARIVRDLINSESVDAPLRDRLGRHGPGGALRHRRAGRRLGRCSGPRSRVEARRGYV